jgi:hypothetical protein
MKKLKNGPSPGAPHFSENSDSGGGGLPIHNFQKTLLPSLATHYKFFRSL